MSPARLSALDAALLSLESAAAPMHVGFGVYAHGEDADRIAENIGYGLDELLARAVA